MGLSLLSNWSAPKAMEHGLTQPAPMDMSPKEESKKKSWAGVADSQVMLDLGHEGGCSCAITAVSHSSVIPCHNFHDSKTVKFNV